jgi:hypothetical protein
MLMPLRELVQRGECKNCISGSTLPEQGNRPDDTASFGKD